MGLFLYALRLRLTLHRSRRSSQKTRWSASSHDLSGLRRRLGHIRRSVQMDFSLRTKLTCDSGGFIAHERVEECDNSLPGGGDNNHVLTLLRGRSFRRVFLSGLETRSESYNPPQRLISANTHPRNSLRTFGRAYTKRQCSAPSCKKRAVATRFYLVQLLSFLVYSLFIASQGTLFLLETRVSTRPSRSYCQTVVHLSSHW